MDESPKVIIDLIVMVVYDVTRRETYTNLSGLWAKEVEQYSTNQECVKILVGNKVDKVRYMVLLTHFLCTDLFG